MCTGLNTTSEQSLNKHSFQFGNDADRLTAVKTNRDPGSSSYNLCMLVVCLRSKLGYFTLRLLVLGKREIALRKQTAIVVSLETLVRNWVDEDVLF